MQNRNVLLRLRFDVHHKYKAMATEDVFSPIDHYFLLTGCKIFKTSTKLQVINNFLYAFQVFCTLHYTFIQIDLVFNENNHLAMIAWTMFYAFAFVHGVRLRIIASELKIVLESFISSLNDIDKRKLFQLARYCFVIGMAYYILCLFFMYSEYLHSDMDTKISYFVFRYPVRSASMVWAVICVTYQAAGIFCISWYLHSINLYIFVSYAVYLQDIAFHICVLKPLSRIQHMKRDFYSSTFQTLVKIKQNRQHFEEVCNFLPFLWFTYACLACSGYINQFSNEEIYSILNVAEYIFFIAYLFTSLFFISFINSKLQKSTKSVLDSLMLTDTSESQYKTLLIEEFKQNSKIQFTASNFFRLEKSFALTFISAVSSFTVLFLQMAHSN